jgi:ABC-type multidrug transport system fused ATPase/permease subunit
MRANNLILFLLIFVLLAYPVSACLGPTIKNIYYNDESKKVIQSEDYENNLHQYIQDFYPDYCAKYGQSVGVLCFYVLPQGWKIVSCSSDDKSCVDYDSIKLKTASYTKAELDNEVVFQPQNLLTKNHVKIALFILFLLTLVVLLIVWYLSKRLGAIIVARNLLFALSISLPLFSMFFGSYVTIFSTSCGGPWTAGKLERDVPSLAVLMFVICILAASALHILSKLKEGLKEVEKEGKKKPKKK